MLCVYIWEMWTAVEYEGEKSMKIKKKYILRDIAGEHILIPVGDTALTFNGLITLNEVGLFLWEKLQNDITKDDLLKEVLSEYDVDKQTALQDIEEFLESLMEKGIIE